VLDLDLADPFPDRTAAEEAHQVFDSVHLSINNAGVELAGPAGDQRPTYSSTGAAQVRSRRRASS
jgi:hypothetical protein